MVNFPLSVWPPTAFQIRSHLRPSPVENFGYHPGSLNPICSSKGRMSWRAALGVEFPSGGRLEIGRISSLTSMGALRLRTAGLKPSAVSAASLHYIDAPRFYFLHLRSVNCP